VSHSSSEMTIIPAEPRVINHFLKFWCSWICTISVCQSRQMDLMAEYILSWLQLLSAYLQN